MSRHSLNVALLAGSTCLTAFAAAFVLAAPVLAQDSATTKTPFTLDPLVLRAGQPKVASEVPQSVSVVDAAELDDIAPVHIGEVLATVPGVAGVGSGSFFGQGFNIRGFGSSSAAAAVAVRNNGGRYYWRWRRRSGHR